MTENRGKFNSFTHNPRPKAISDTEQQRIDLDRELVRRGGLRKFVELAWHIVESRPLVTNWHIDAVCTHLEALYSGDIKRLLINIPPACMKSRLACVFGPVWAWIQDPGLWWMALSCDGDLTYRDANDSMRIIQSEWFQKRWGDVYSVAPASAVTNHHNSKGGNRVATSMEGKIIGKHPDILIIDDPLKSNEMTDNALDKVIETWTTALSTRARDPKTLRICCIMQRLHKKDLANYMLETEKGYVHLMLPMRYEPKRKCITTYFEDPRTVEGELLWPERFDETEVQTRELKLRAMGTAAQLQQNPIVEGGAIFKTEWFKFYNPAEMPKMGQIIHTWDCAFKKTDTSDHVVGQVWGRVGVDFYLLDEVRAQMNFPETKNAIMKLRVKWPNAMAILIEDKANGPALESVLRSSVMGLLMVDPRGGKESRANSVSSLYEAGNVYYPDPNFTLAHGARPYAWVIQHIAELEGFPTFESDDRVDAMSQGLIYLSERRSNLVAAMEAMKERGAGSSLLRPGGLFGTGNRFR